VREEDIALTRGMTLEVQLLDPAGHGLSGVAVLVVESDVAAGVEGGEEIHPDEFWGKEIQTVRSGSSGRVTFRNLANGGYRLLLRSESWMLARPLYVWADAGQVVAQAVPALSVNVRVHDIETRKPVRRFDVRLGLGGDPIALKGGGGKLARRMRWAAADRVLATLDIDAPGYLKPPQRTVSTGASVGKAHRYWLLPDRPPNTRIRVRYADGTPYEGLARASIKALEFRATASVDLGVEEPGVLATTLPPGSWRVRLELASLLFPPRLEWFVIPTRSLEVEREVTVPAGGTLILRRPVGWSRPGYSGYPAYVRTAKRMRALCLGREAMRLDGVPPGSRQLGCEERVDKGTSSTHTVRWFRTITIGVGDEIVVAMPDR